MRDGAEEIAKGLTKAQREAMLDLGAADAETRDELAALGLAWFMGSFIDDDTLEYVPARWELRQKGLAVCAILETPDAE